MSKAKIYTDLLDIQRKCFEFAQIHSAEAKKLSTQNTIFNICNIVITTGVATLTTTFTSINNRENTENFVPVSIISVVLLYISAVLNSVQQFLNFEKLSEKNKITSVKFITLGNNIKRFLAIEELQTQDIVEYYKWATTTQEEIISATTKDEVNLELSNSPGFSITAIPENILDIDFEENNNDEHLYINNANDKIKYEIDRFRMDSYLKK